MFDDRLASMLSSAIVRVRRINYVQPGGARDVDEGPFEVTLDSGAVYRLESGDDGESLRLAVGEWVDSFAEPLSLENREFVARSGKWVAFDVSSDRDFCRLIGARLDDLNLLITSGRIVGVELVFGLATLRAEVRGDELYIDFRYDNDR
ncbi:hypothetical protein [Micromonospora sp. RV43]|uniref:hypothetical protein n=1 Tax=Micromonospora sp. RV43 TaxID=1661387 RepID=UPI00064C0386|nr:hypothetical protein [Micromonospora sp. RV43]